MLLASFGSKDTTVTVNVSIFDDDLVENNEVFQLSIDLPPSTEKLGILKGTSHIADAVIINDDSESLYLSLIGFVV